MKDKTLYSFVEVVFSYATIVVTLIDLGFSSYLFRGYKTSEDKIGFINKAEFFFKFILFIYCILSIPLILWTKYYDEKITVLFILVCVRALFTFYVTFYANISRLKDKPSKIYLLTISVNVISFILLIMASFFSWNNKLMYFFLPSLTLIMVVNLKYLLSEISFLKIVEFINFLKMALLFSWPIILNVLAMGLMNNYAKIYAYNNLTQVEMIQISYIMRLGLIIHLTHSSFATFYAKSIFMDVKHKFNFPIFKQYSIVLLMSTFLVILILLGTNYFFKSLIQIPLTLSTFFFMFYIVLWCYIAYLELYFGIMNSNKKILYYSIISSVTYIFLLKINSNVSLLQLSLVMSISAALNLTLVVIGLNKLGIFTAIPPSFKNETEISHEFK